MAILGSSCNSPATICDIALVEHVRLYICIYIFSPTREDSTGETCACIARYRSKATMEDVIMRRLEARRVANSLVVAVVMVPAAARQKAHVAFARLPG